jgi:hypothetical protein
MVLGYESLIPPAELKDPRVVFIVYGMKPPGVMAFTLFVTWPNRDLVHTWCKHDKALTYHFPVWTLDELKLLRTHCFDGRSYSANVELPAVELTDEELQRRYDTVGGVPRFIFNEAKWCNAPNEIDDSIDETMKNIENLGVSLALKSEFYISHSSIHLIVNRDTFKIERLDFASSLASSLFSRKLADQDRSVLLRVLRATRDEPKLASFRGRIHESLVHRA